jgi:hypothetical protein
LQRITTFYGRVHILLIFVIDIVVVVVVVLKRKMTGKEFGAEKGMGSSIEACHFGELRRRHSAPRPPVSPAVGSRQPTMQPRTAGT